MTGIPNETRSNLNAAGTAIPNETRSEQRNQTGTNISTATEEISGNVNLDGPFNLDQLF